MFLDIFIKEGGDKMKFQNFKEKVEEITTFLESISQEDSRKELIKEGIFTDKMDDFKEELVSYYIELGLERILDNSKEIWGNNTKEFIKLDKYYLEKLQEINRNL